jgi:replicative DNA helicase
MAQSERIERTALRNLVFNEEYTRRVIPFIRKEYFEDRAERTIFEEIQKFVTEYNKNPTRETLEIDLQKRKDLNETEYNRIVDVIKSLNPQEVDLDWLINTTEKFCKDRAIHNAVLDGLHIIVGKDNRRSQWKWQKKE